MRSFLKKAFGVLLVTGAVVAWYASSQGKIESTARAIGVLLASIGSVTFFFAEYIAYMILPTKAGIATASPAIVFRILGVVEVLIGAACLIWG